MTMNMSPKARNVELSRENRCARLVKGVVSLEYCPLVKRGLCRLRTRIWRGQEQLSMDTSSEENSKQVNSATPSQMPYLRPISDPDPRQIGRAHV